MDFRVGGARLICMRITTLNGLMTMWFTGEYREVVENVLLACTGSMSNENGDILAPADLGTPPGHPVTTEIRVELEDLAGSTRMVMTHLGVPAGSPGATGRTMALDKLGALIDAQS